MLSIVYLHTCLVVGTRIIYDFKSINKLADTSSKQVKQAQRRRRTIYEFHSCLLSQRGRALLAGHLRAQLRNGSWSKWNVYQMIMEFWPGAQGCNIQNMTSSARKRQALWLTVLGLLCGSSGNRRDARGNKRFLCWSKRNLSKSKSYNIST